MDTKLLETVAAAVERRIKLHHKLYTLPVIAEQWEEILVGALRDSGVEAEWDAGSHKVGEDINTTEFGRISCKSGTLKKPTQGANKDVETVNISGSRTTKLKTLASKVKYLSQNHDDCYFLLPKYTRDVSTGNYRYWMAVFSSKLIKPKNLKWKRKGNNFVAEGRGIKQSISTAMSGQLWTTVETHKIPYWFEINAN